MENIFVAFGNMAWGMPLVFLLLGGGLYFFFYSGFTPFRYFGHAIDILRGKYDDPNAPGELNHYEALSSALAATVGMGNISGVAVAITTGGPGALFWMWMSAFVGMATKYFTCSLAIMYRGKDDKGNDEGGPMYVIINGMGKKWKPLALFFCIACIFGCLPIFQANQLTILLLDTVDIHYTAGQDSVVAPIIAALIIMVTVGAVILGGIKRIGKVAGKMVPFMVIIYMLAVLSILALNIQEIIPTFSIIFADAFTGDAVQGGVLGAVILAGARRAAFSNEAGLGTAPMAHGAAKTNEPIREGLVAMLGPAIDTLIVCTLTGLAVLIASDWQANTMDGVMLTKTAFEASIPLGGWILSGCAIVFSFTTLFTYSYYGGKSISFLLNKDVKKYYNYFYLISIIWGATAPLKSVIGLIDGMYAMMVIPTMVSAIWLSPKVKAAGKDYFKRLQKVSN